MRGNECTQSQLGLKVCELAEDTYSHFETIFCSRVCASSSVSHCMSHQRSGRVIRVHAAGLDAQAHAHQHTHTHMHTFPDSHIRLLCHARIHMQIVLNHVGRARHQQQSLHSVNLYDNFFDVCQFGNSNTPLSLFLCYGLNRVILHRQRTYLCHMNGNL